MSRSAIRGVAFALMIVVALTTVLGYDALFEEWFNTLKWFGFPNGCF